MARKKNKTMLITGGAGFIGSNAALYFGKKGWNVIVVDNFSRKPGSPLNAEWLKKEIPGITVVELDISEKENRAKLTELVSKADAVLHLAAQVAVTLSVNDPEHDLKHNLFGTFNLLEAIRTLKAHPIVVYASTNKVYGELSEVSVKKTPKGYRYDKLPHGVTEKHALDFHSPYGCSKGAADQYIIDYSRIYGVPTVVFRQSCIYGDRQFGSEDQGWVAWFAIQSALGRPITIYGDGHQSRDVLHMNDLNRAYELAIENIDRAKGKAYNIGGGKDNQFSVLSLINLLEKISGKKVAHSFDQWRPGDQKTYSSDIRRAKKDFGWEPQIDVEEGVSSLVDWIRKHKELFEKLYVKK